MKDNILIPLCYLIIPLFLCLLSGFSKAQKIDISSEPNALVEHFKFVGDHREESMWSALYRARSGKIYIGLCTHAEAAHFYEFDPETRIDAPSGRSYEPAQ